MSLSPTKLTFFKEFKLRCSFIFFNKILEFVYKKCENGVWHGFNKTFKSFGFTDYESCMTESALRHLKIPVQFLKKLIFETIIFIFKFQNYDLILKIVLGEELVGITLSFICILFSLFIFIYHRNLINNRTRIHLNLFVAILLQSIIRLVFFIDELVYKLNLKEGNNQAEYESQMMKIHISFCPIFTTFLEYFQV